MISRIFISFLLILIFQHADAQVNSLKRPEISAGVISLANTSNSDVKLSDGKSSERVGGNQQYLEAGLNAERELKDKSLRSDRDLQSKDFIIERSSDIKIIYSPSGKRQEN